MARVIAAGAAALLADLVDYAGLFPPAGLSMGAAAEEYSRALRSPERWMLGRFVVPASRLPELAEATSRRGGDPWRVSVLVAGDLQAEIDAVAAARDSGVVVDAVEVKAATAGEIDRALAGVPRGLAAFVELPVSADPAPLLEAVAERGARAKVRTGGVTPEAIPSPEELARFLAGCAETGTAFKATAGLHHPVRSLRPLTYAADSPTATMHGFLNVFAAAALAREGAGAREIEEILREEEPERFAFDDQGLSAGSHTLAVESLRATRTTFALGFGSCSFAEPVADLESLGLL